MFSPLKGIEKVGVILYDIIDMRDKKCQNVECGVVGRSRERSKMEYCKGYIIFT